MCRTRRRSTSSERRRSALSRSSAETSRSAGTPSSAQACSQERRRAPYSPSRVLVVNPGVHDQQRQSRGVRVERHLLGRHVAGVQQQGVARRAQAPTRSWSIGPGRCPDGVVLGALGELGEPVAGQRQAVQVGHRERDGALDRVPTTTARSPAAPGRPAPGRHRRRPARPRAGPRRHRGRTPTSRPPCRARAPRRSTRRLRPAAAARRPARRRPRAGPRPRRCAPRWRRAARDLRCSRCARRSGSPGRAPTQTPSGVCPVSSRNAAPTAEASLMSAASPGRRAGWRRSAPGRCR